MNLPITITNTHTKRIPFRFLMLRSHVHVLWQCVMKNMCERKREKERKATEWIIDSWTYVHFFYRNIHDVCIFWENQSEENIGEIYHGMVVHTQLYPFCMKKQFQILYTFSMNYSKLNWTFAFTLACTFHECVQLKMSHNKSKCHGTCLFLALFIIKTADSYKLSVIRGNITTAIHHHYHFLERKKRHLIFICVTVSQWLMMPLVTSLDNFDKIITIVDNAISEFISCEIGSPVHNWNNVIILRAKNTLRNLLKTAQALCKHTKICEAFRQCIDMIFGQTKISIPIVIVVVH